MFDTSWIAGLDADAACRAIAGTQVDLRESEWRELALAAHWADLHDEHTLPTSGGSVLGGMERATPWTSATGTRSCGPGWVPAWVGCGRPAGSPG